MLKQNDAVFGALVSVCNENGSSFEAGQIAYEVIEDSWFDSIVQIVTEGLMTGKVSFTDKAKSTHTTEASVRKYVSGMVDNHFRKDKRMNGGDKYVPKNPGSRAGSGDETVKNLRNLLAQTSDATAQESIKSAITKRVDELKALKPKATKKAAPINADLIPAELQYLIPQA